MGGIMDSESAERIRQDIIAGRITYEVAAGQIDGEALRGVLRDCREEERPGDLDQPIFNPWDE